MIILRAKNYSIAKDFIRKTINSGDRVMTKIDNVGLKAGDGVKSFLGSPVKNKTFKFQEASPGRLEELTNKVDGAIDKVTSKKEIKKHAKNVSDGVKKFAVHPGHYIDKGTRLVVENPISTAGELAGVPINALTYTVSPTAGTMMAASPIGPGKLGIVLENRIKSSSPKYRKFTKDLGDKYSRSKLSSGIKNLPTGNTMSEYIGRYGAGFGL